MAASINTHCLMVSKMDGMLTATPRLPQTVFTSERIAKKTICIHGILCHASFSVMSFFHAIILITKFLYFAALFIQKRRIFCSKDTKKTPRHQINLGYIKRYQKLFHFLFYRFIFLDTFNSVGMNNSTGHLSAFSYRLEFYHKEIVYAIVTGEHIIILRDTILFTLHFGAVCLEMAAVNTFLRTTFCGFLHF